MEIDGAEGGAGEEAPLSELTMETFASRKILRVAESGEEELMPELSREERFATSVDEVNRFFLQDPDGSVRLAYDRAAEEAKTQQLREEHPFDAMRRRLTEANGELKLVLDLLDYIQQGTSFRAVLASKNESDMPEVSVAAVRALIKKKTLAHSGGVIDKAAAALSQALADEQVYFSALVQLRRKWRLVSAKYGLSVEFGARPGDLATRASLVRPLDTKGVKVELPPAFAGTQSLSFGIAPRDSPLAPAVFVAVCPPDEAETDPHTLLLHAQRMHTASLLFKSLSAAVRDARLKNTPSKVTHSQVTLTCLTGDAITIRYGAPLPSDEAAGTSLARLAALVMRKRFRAGKRSPGVTAEATLSVLGVVEHTRFRNAVAKELDLVADAFPLLRFHWRPTGLPTVSGIDIFFGQRRMTQLVLRESRAHAGPLHRGGRSRTLGAGDIRTHCLDAILALAVSELHSEIRGLGLPVSRDRNTLTIARYRGLAKISLTLALASDGRARLDVAAADLLTLKAVGTKTLEWTDRKSVV